MSTLLSTDNPYYRFKLIDDDKDFINKTKIDNDLVITLYVLKGELNLDYKNEKLTIFQDQVILISTSSLIKDIKISKNSKVLEISSIKTTKDVIEIIDVDGHRRENIIEDYKIVKKHKSVSKPWGHEIWYVWFKDYHVLKKIFMKKGNKCSLQYHDQKYETNFLVDGKAKIIKGLYINLNDNKKNIFEKILNTDLHNDYSTVSNAPYVFTNVPGEVHRVYSEEDYTAYEVSTPQLDDVVRVQDDSKRASGLIASEHK